MKWHWYWPHKAGSWKGLLYIDIHFKDYGSRGFSILIGILGWFILDFGYHNAKHH